MVGNYVWRGASTAVPMPFFIQRGHCGTLPLYPEAV